MRPLAVLRPEPGNAATAARIAAAGGVAIRLPLFAVRALDWTVPDPAAHDALFLTSANAVRHAGPRLAALAGLPVHAVGPATAAAAEAAGLRVAAVGAADAAALARSAAEAGVRRALHLAGRDRASAALPGVSATVAVYASEAVAVDPAVLAGTVALVHSPRAGARLAELVAARAAVAVAALSAPAAEAAGAGWARIAVAAAPDDAALVAAALRLAR